MTRSSPLVRFLAATVGVGMLFSQSTYLSQAATDPVPPPGFAAGSGGPALISPPNGAQLAEMSVVTRWSNPGGATQFQIQVAPSNADGPGIDLIIGDAGQVAAQAMTVPAPAMGQGPYILLPDLTYFWRVRTSSAGVGLRSDSPEWGPWSNLSTFRTPTRTASSIKPIAPQDDQRVASTTPTLVWGNGQPDVFYYEVQLSKDPAFNTEAPKAWTSVYWVLLHGGQSNPANSWTAPPLEGRSFYYWRVRPRVQGDGRPVPWSPTSMFKTP